MAKILFFGDIVGKPGRKALAKVLPAWQAEYQPDLVIANVENLAHGKGVTASTLKELEDLGVEVFTSGNHVFDKKPQAQECFEKYPQLIRPANYLSLAPQNGEPNSVPGAGFYRLEKNNQQFLIINLGGRVFFESQFKGGIDNPFLVLDRVLLEESQKDDIILVDFHCEATSEKNALGWYADGRVAAIVGTHTHVPTADAKILPGGTAYITDIGMTGPKDSVIGVKVENALNVFLEKTDKFVMDVAEAGPMAVNAALVETDRNKAVAIDRLYREIET